MKMQMTNPDFVFSGYLIFDYVISEQEPEKWKSNIHGLVDLWISGFGNLWICG